MNNMTIGEIRPWRGIEYRCERAHNLCNACAFEEFCLMCWECGDNLGKCAADMRDDNQDVIFTVVEKGD